MSKKLIISMKSTSDMFSDFVSVTKKAKAGKAPKSCHYEISFEDPKEFNRFVRNISLLVNILNLKPKSIYELAKLTNRDLANVKKLVLFFEDIGALKIKEQVKAGRKVKTPIVEYDKIEFDLQVA